MYSTSDVRDLIGDLLKEQALALGGLVAVHEIDDDLVWRLVKNLDAVRGRVFRRLDEDAPDPDEAASDPRSNLRPHPAIEDFLLRLRRS